MIINGKRPIEIILLKHLETNSAVMRFHEYQRKWDPIIDEILETGMEQMRQINMQWPPSSNGRSCCSFTKRKRIFYFLKSEESCSCKVKAQEKDLNLAKGIATKYNPLFTPVLSRPKKNLELLEELLKDCK